MNPAVLLSGAGWTPRRPPGLLAWFDATVGVTVIAGGVSQWNDQSGNGFNLTQSTASGRPTYQATGWNSNRPTISFDGTNDTLVSTAAGFADYANGTNPPLSLFLTFRPTLVVSTQTICEWVNDPAATSSTNFSLDSSVHLFPNHNTVGPSGSTNVAGANRRVAFLASGGTIDAYVDATLDINAGSFSATTSAQNRFIMGMNDLGAAPYFGIVSELVIYSRRLSVADFSAYRTYSNAKFGA